MKGEPHVSTPFSILGLVVGLSLIPSSATAQAQACNDRLVVLSHLAKKYNEAPVAIGVTDKGGLIEVLTTSDGNTWTIIVSMPNGQSCMVAAGEGWRSLPRTKQEGPKV